MGKGEFHDQFLLVLKELDIFSKNEQAVTLVACHLSQYRMLNKVIHQSTCGIGMNFLMSNKCSQIDIARVLYQIHHFIVRVTV